MDFFRVNMTGRSLFSFSLTSGELCSRALLVGLWGALDLPPEVQVNS